MSRILINGKEKSCGAVVYTEQDGELRYLILLGIHSVHSFPKGHIEPGETEHETAAREIFEETGLRPTFHDGFRMTEEYDTRKKGIRKEVVYFLARYEGETVVPLEGEIVTAELLPFGEAYRTLERESARKILAAANAFLEERRLSEGAVPV